MFFLCLQEELALALPFILHLLAHPLTIISTFNRDTVQAGKILKENAETLTGFLLFQAAMAVWKQ